MLLAIDISEFFGHFHVVVVHFPIGFLLLGGLFFLMSKERKFSFLIKALPVTFFSSAVASSMAVVFGWLLAWDGGYDESTLFWHRWLGVCVALISVIAWRWSIGKFGNRNRSTGRWIIVIGVILIFVTGHFGGELTHGAGYLTKALKSNKNQSALNIPDQPDSIIVYKHLIQPVLEKRCYDCHNEKGMRGGLDLSTIEGIKKGGENGAILADNAWNSELFKRVTMPQLSKKFMPTKGEPMTFGEKQILKWWINQGAEFDARLTGLKLSDEIKEVLTEAYEIDTKPKPFVETIQVEPLPEANLNQIKDNGWKANTLSENNFLIEIAPDSIGKVTIEQLQNLTIAKDHITWLDLSGSEISDEHLKIIGTFSNLSRLRLQNNSITDAGLEHLRGLKNLESLNLYNNPITDEGLKTVEQFPALKRLYLWQTKVTEEGKENLKKNRPGLELS